MEHKNILFLASLFFIIFLSLTSSVDARFCNLITPPTNSVIGGNDTRFNITYDGITFVGTNHNFTLWAQSTSTANSTWVAVYTNHTNNVSATNKNLSFTFNSSVLEDAPNYDFNITCHLFNDTVSDYNTSLVTGIDVDNTVPTAPSSLIPTSDTDGIFVFNSTIIGRQTTACTLSFIGTNPGESSYAMTHGGNACWYSISSVPDQSYRWYVTASDGTNTTDSSTQTTTVDIQSGSSGGGLTEKQIKQAEGKQAGWGWIIGIAIIIAVFYFIFKKK